MEIRLFGPVEIWSNRRTVDLGPPRQRHVLAALAVDAGRVVAVPGLIDRVWDEAPDAARRALYAYIARLRRVLADADDGSQPQLLRRSGGYVLEVEADLVDLHRFDLLLAQARGPACPPQRRLELLRAALGLWRGEPLEGLAGDWPDRVRQRCHQQRVEALVTWTEAEIGFGDPSRAIEVLTEVEGRYRLVEPLACASMRALYAAGRQAEALECYARTRERLADELGVDPGTQLRQLHQAVLRGELDSPTSSTSSTSSPPAGRNVAAAGNGARTEMTPADESPLPRGRPAAGTNGYTVPAQLPPPLAGFAGRGAELGRLDALLPCDEEQAPAAVVISAIAGTAGVGKTALAVHWAHRVAGRFGDGQLYVNLRGFDPAAQPMKPAEAIRRFLDALKVPPQRIPADPDSQADLYRSLMAGKRILVVLDNARDTDQVLPLLPGSSGCQVVVTSRNRLTGLVAAQGAHLITLDLLTMDEARQLLNSRLGSNRVTAESDAAGEIIHRCARLPLALAIVAARAAAHPGFPLHALAADLRDAQTGLDAFADDDATDVRAVFSWSYHQLSIGAARLFRLLGLHPGPDTSAAAAASLAGQPPQQVRPLLKELARAHLVTEHAPGRYTFHDLLRAYATELAHTHDTADDRREAASRVLDHYLHTAHTADRLLNPLRDPVTLTQAQPGVASEPLIDRGQAMAWFTTEHPVLLAALDHAAGTGFDTHTWQLVWSLSDYLDRRGHRYDQGATWRAGLDATRRLGDQDGQALAHRHLGWANGWLGRFDNAHTHLQQALDLYRELADPIGKAHTHRNLGWMFERQGRHSEALEHSKQSLALYQAADHRAGHARALNAVGWHHALLGNHHQALTSCRQALDMHQQLGYCEGEADTWDSLGYAHHHLGQHQDAFTCYRRALHLHRDLGDRYSQALVLTHLGGTHHATGDLTTAHDTWQEALAILDDLNHPDAEDVRCKLDQTHQGP